MELNEVVRKIIKRDRSGVIVELAAECIRQSRVAPVTHTHAEVLPFYKAGADVFWIRIPNDGLLLASDAHGGAVALLSLGRLAIYFDQLGIVQIHAAPSVIDSLQIGPV